MSMLARDGTAKPVSRDQVLRQTRMFNGDREISIFHVQLTASRIGNLTRLIYTPLYYVMYRDTSFAFYIFNIPTSYRVPIVGVGKYWHTLIGPW